MSPELRVFLLDLRQHPLFAQLMKEVPPPTLPEYRPSRGDTLETVGAKSAYASGQLDQYRQWRLLLTGELSDKGEDI